MGLFGPNHRKARKGDEIAYTAKGDLSVYPDAVRFGAFTYPLTPTTVAVVDEAGLVAVHPFVMLRVTDTATGLSEAHKWEQIEQRKARKMADAINGAVRVRSGL
jgi:hypothetical protein